MLGRFPGSCYLVSAGVLEALASFSRFSDLFGCIWMRFDAFGCVWISLDASGCVWMHSDAFGKKWNVSKQIDPKIQVFVIFVRFCEGNSIVSSFQCLFFYAG